MILLVPTLKVHQRIDTSGPNNTAGGAVTIKTAARDPGSGTTTNANIIIGGDITTSGGTSTSGGGYAGGAVTITATGAGTISVSSDADIVTTGSAANSGDNAGGAGGNVTLDNAGTTLTLNDTLILLLVELDQDPAQLVMVEISLFLILSPSLLAKSN